MGLTKPIFTMLSTEFSGRDIILILGGLFLIGKSTHEIHNSLEGDSDPKKTKIVKSLTSVLIQIALIDIIFSLDSVITAVGLAEHIEVMILAIIISVIIMMISSKAISEFVETHPTMKMLALSFLILVGVALFGEGFDLHIPKGYIYFAMAFSMTVEILNMKIRKKYSRKVKLHRSIPDS